MDGFVKHAAGVAPDLAAALAQAMPIVEEEAVWGKEIGTPLRASGYLSQRLPRADPTSAHDLALTPPHGLATLARLSCRVGPGWVGRSSRARRRPSGGRRAERMEVRRDDEECGRAEITVDMPQVGR